MQPRWRLTALSLSLAFSPASVAAQTHYVTGAPTVVSAGAFATTVVFEGGEIFVGRPGEFAFFPIPANHAGTVHVFGLDDMGNWEETAVLSSESVEVGDGFGMSLAVHGNTLLAGAPKTRGGRGAVYVFTRSDADAPWRAVTTLRSGTRREGDEFGAAVAIDGEFALIGSPGRMRNTGAVVVFRLLAGAWTEVATVEGSATSPDERFGSALAVDGNRLLVGAPGPFPGIPPGNPSPRRAGSAYVFDLEGGRFVESAHNLYVRGQFMYQSNYVSGLRILDISDPVNPHEVGYFDSVPVGDNSPGFAGSWSNYPFFESGVIVFTSMREGLFVVRRGRQPVL